MPQHPPTEEAHVTGLDPASLRAFKHDLDPALHTKLGSHLLAYQGQVFTRFSVWAPAARQVSVVGDFNEWNAAQDPLFPIEDTGVWSTLIPGSLQDQRYQFSIIGPDGQSLLKTDPFANRFASTTDRSAIVASPIDYPWRDQPWLHQRSGIDWKRSPISIYELHIGSWKRSGHPNDQAASYRTMAEPLARYLTELGFTHVLFMPLMEHPFDGSWGYQVTGYYAATHRYGTASDLAFLVDTLHQHKIGVLFDWVPAHFPKDAFALYQFDGSPCFENPCPQQGNHPDWGTAIFDYNKPEVLSFLISSALYWIQTFHFDGIRVDAVASMIYRDYSRPSGDWTPNVEGGNENLEATRFIRLLNDQIAAKAPGVIRIAEESTPWPGVTKDTAAGGLGFDFKWNLGWMHDTLAYFTQNQEGRSRSRWQLTLPASYQHQENFCLPFSHDEVVHGKASMLNKMPGEDIESKAAQLRALYAWMWAWPGKKLLFMGNEFGQPTEWNYNRELEWDCSLQAPHRGLQRLVTRLNTLYHQHSALSYSDSDTDRFSCPTPSDQESEVFRFTRLGDVKEDTLICIGNFSSLAVKDYRLGVPAEGPWSIKLNSSWTQFDGSTPPGETPLPSQARPCQEQAHSVTLNLPAHSTLYIALLNS